MKKNRGLWRVYTHGMPNGLCRVYTQGKGPMWRAPVQSGSYEGRPYGSLPSQDTEQRNQYTTNISAMYPSSTWRNVEPQELRRSLAHFILPYLHFYTQPKGTTMN
jgi:hypothetical protein